MNTDRASKAATTPGDGATAPDPAAGQASEQFGLFTSGVLDIPEHGEEVVVSTHVWKTEELILTRHVTERVEVVRTTLRRADVDVQKGDPPHRA